MTIRLEIARTTIDFPTQVDSSAKTCLSRAGFTTHRYSALSSQRVSVWMTLWGREATGEIDVNVNNPLLSSKRPMTTNRVRQNFRSMGKGCAQPPESRTPICIVPFGVNQC